MNRLSFLLIPSESKGTLAIGGNRIMNQLRLHLCLLKTNLIRICYDAHIAPYVAIPMLHPPEVLVKLGTAFLTFYFHFRSISVVFLRQ